jgi:hypothetical protein
VAYSINDIDLSTYGFVPTPGEGSNLAISGCWDMPKRTGKTHHVWAETSYVEPYVDADDMRFAGRDIVLHGIIIGDSLADTNEKVQALRELLNYQTELMELSCEWGTWMVKLGGMVRMAHEDENTAKVVIQFREPVVSPAAEYTGEYDAEVNEPVPTAQFNDVDGIDGVAFSDLGFSPLKLDYLSLSQPQEQFFNAYQNEGYQMTLCEGDKLVLKGFLKGEDYAELVERIEGLRSVFSAPGLRWLTVGNDAAASVWAEEGFEVSDMMLMDGEALASFEITLHLVFVAVNIWEDEEGNFMTDENDEVLYVS